MSNNLIDLSVVYQRRLERQLAGFALAHPVEALSIYREIKEIMIDDLAISFFEKLIKHENELQELCIDDQISLVYSIAIEVDPVVITKEFNETGVGIYGWLSTEEISVDLGRRIKNQHLTREGLTDLGHFALSYIERFNGQ